SVQVKRDTILPLRTCGLSTSGCFFLRALPGAADGVALLITLAVARVALLPLPACFLLPDLLDLGHQGLLTFGHGLLLLLLGQARQVSGCLNAYQTAAHRLLQLGRAVPHDLLGQVDDIAADVQLLGRLGGGLALATLLCARSRVRRRLAREHAL